MGGNNNDDGIRDGFDNGFTDRRGCCTNSSSSSNYYHYSDVWEISVPSGAKLIIPKNKNVDIALRQLTEAARLFYKQIEELKKEVREENKKTAGGGGEG